MPSIEGGGVEKNLFLITNYLVNKFRSITIITASQNISRFDKKIKIIKPKKNNYFLKFRYIKIIISIFFFNYGIVKKKKNSCTKLSS